MDAIPVAAGLPRQSRDSYGLCDFRNGATNTKPSSSSGRNTARVLTACFPTPGPLDLQFERGHAPHGAGNRLAPDVFLAPIGAGGVGEVYEPKDTRLDCTVAFNGLPIGSLGG